jgi:hypothetical protein
VAEELTTMTNLGKWDAWYADLTPNTIRNFGDCTMYRMAGTFLADVVEVEDWGCGSGGFKPFCHS